MNIKITSQEFYSIWKDVVSINKETLLAKWKLFRAYTYEIINKDHSVIETVAKELGLCCYTTNYYSLDSVLYTKEDVVPHIKENTHWFREIKVAFEHENSFNKNLYQEVSHLLITRCQLRVLVTYPNNNKNHILEYLHEIIKGTSIEKEISDSESFLLILGYETDFEWEGLVYKSNGWFKIS